MNTFRPYWVLFLVIIFFACSKEGIELFEGFRRPTYFPASAYDFSDNKVTASGFSLGKMLFHDSTLSIDNSTSCASCHMQSAAFTHHEHNLSHGLNGSLTHRNSPPIMNLAWGNTFMWDGSVASLDKQALRPLTSPIEMGETVPGVLKKLNSSSMYKKMFFDAFGTPVATEDRMLKAAFTVYGHADQQQCQIRQCEKRASNIYGRGKRRLPGFSKQMQCLPY